MFLPLNTGLGDALDNPSAPPQDAIATQGLQSMFAHDYPIYEAAFNAGAGYSALPTTTKAKIEQYMNNAYIGINTQTVYARDMFYYSLADQLLTIAPSSTIDAIQQVAHQKFGLSAHPTDPINWKAVCDDPVSYCNFLHFLVALDERRRAFIPLSSEPTATNPVLTQDQRVQIIGATSAESQVIAAPYAGSSQTAQVVTQPTYIPSAPLPETGATPVSATPAPIYNALPNYDMPILQGPSSVHPGSIPTPASGSTGDSTIWLLAAILGFVVLSKKHR